MSVTLKVDFKLDPDAESGVDSIKLIERSLTFDMGDGTQVEAARVDWYLLRLFANIKN